MKANRRLRLLAFASLAVTAAALPGRARAAIVTIDQQNTAATGSQQNATTGGGFGQSFIPTLPGVNAVTFTLNSGFQVPSQPAGPGENADPAGVTPAATTDRTLRVDLFAGSGYSGMLMASTNPVVVTSTTAATAEFDFPAAVTLIPGNTYTFRVTFVSTGGNGSTLDYYNIGDSGNTYARGTELAVSGAANAGDLTFTEGFTTVVVAPEPSTWVLLGVGAFSLGLTLRARRG